MKNLKLLVACIVFLMLSCTKENAVMPKLDNTVSDQKHRVGNTINDNVIRSYDGYACVGEGGCAATKCRPGSGNTCSPPHPCECIGAKYPNLSDKEIDNIFNSLPFE